MFPNDENPESLPVDDLLSIDEICAHFERTWDPDKTREISGYLEQTSEHSKSVLIKELIITDLEQRSLAACLQPQGYYEQAFPSFADEIGAAHREALDLGICPPGTRLGRYLLKEAIGVGSMGRVYRAFDTELKRDVAIKTMLPGVADVPGRLARFKNEMASVAGLVHPNIVTLHDAGEEEGKAFAVMELLSGEDLAARLKRGKLPVEEALRIAEEVADGITIAHAKGVIHRDLKPANIFLSSTGSAKVLDFGIARLRDPAGTDTTSVQDRTAPGTIVGTIAYMSPEQLRGQEVDRQSDVFSLGTVLLEMLTGKRAFARQSAADTKAAILRDDPLIPYRNDIPVEIFNLLDRCLQKDTEQRLESIEAFADQVRQLMTTGPKPQSKAAHAFGRRAVFWSVISLIGILSGSFWYFSQPTPNSKIRSLAVLPFEGDYDESYIKDGLTISLSNSLARIDGLHVRPFSVVRELHRSEDGLSVQRAGKDLMVDAVLSGYINHIGDEVWIHVELIDAKNNRTVWGADFQESMGDFLNVHKRIVVALSRQMDLESGQTTLIEGGKSTTDLVAYKNYIHGEIALSQRHPDSVRQASEYFKKAVDRDPRFDLALIGLANCYIVQAERNVIEPMEGYERAREYALEAIAINELSIDAQISMAMIEFEYDWAFDQADSRFRKVLKTAQGAATVDHPTGHQWYAEFLSAMGRHDEALEHIRIAYEQDPTSAIIRTIEGLIHFKAGNPDRAIKQLNQVLEDFPNFDRARGYLIDVYESVGDFEQALLQWQALAKSKQPLVVELAQALEMEGDKDYWSARVRHRDTLTSLRPVSPIFMANAFCQVGQSDKAFDILENAIKRKDGALAANILIHPNFDPLRSDPRFEAIVKKIGFPTPPALN